MTESLEFNPWLGPDFFSRGSLINPLIVVFSNLHACQTITNLRVINELQYSCQTLAATGFEGSVIEFCLYQEMGRQDCQVHV